MTQDLYEGFAERYDLFPDRYDRFESSFVDFFRKLFAERGVRTVLDCACGTGRDLLLFSSLGCDVVGSDLSGAMLAQAERNLTKRGLRVPLHRVDFRELLQHFSQRFDAVVCLATSIAHLRDDASVLRAFQSMRGVLRDGGILVLDQSTTDKQWREQPRFILEVDTPQVSRLFALDYRDGGARYNILDIFHEGDEGRLKVWSADLHILLRDDQERLLRAAGFTEVKFYGSFGFDPYDKDTSNHLIAVAQR